MKKNRSRAVVALILLMLPTFAFAIHDEITRVNDGEMTLTVILDLFDDTGGLLSHQETDGFGLVDISNLYSDNGTSVLGGAITFGNKIGPGGESEDGSEVMIHDLALVGLNSGDHGLNDFQLDWFTTTNQVLHEDFDLVIGDDFENGIAYYIYSTGIANDPDADGMPGTAFTVGRGNAYSAQVSLSFATIAPVPLPAAAWLFASGLLGLGAINRKVSRQETRQRAPGQASKAGSVPIY